jgi:hypothetical protein
MRPFKLIMSEDYNNLDEKAWVEKYWAIPHTNFIWKGPRVENFFLYHEL